MRDNVELRVGGWVLLFGGWLSFESELCSQESDPRIPIVASKVAQWLGPAEVTTITTEPESVYRATSQKNVFELVETSVESKAVSKTRFGERELPPSDLMKEEFDDEETFSRLKLFRYEGKIYLKMESRSWLTKTKPVFYLERSDTYEAKVVKGSWEDYENGEPLVLTLAAQDRELYEENLEAACRTPEATAKLVEDYRMGIRRMNENSKEKAMEEGRSPEKIAEVSTAVDYLLESAQVAVSVEVASTLPTLIFHGEQATVTIEETATTLRAMFIPPEIRVEYEEPLNWKEQMYLRSPKEKEGPVRKTPGGIGVAPRLTE